MLVEKLAELIEIRSVAAVRPSRKRSEDGASRRRAVFHATMTFGLREKRRDIKQ